MPLLPSQWCVQHHKPLDDHAAVLGWRLGSRAGCFDISTILNKCQPILL